MHIYLYFKIQTERKGGAGVIVKFTKLLFMGNKSIKMKETNFLATSHDGLSQCNNFMAMK